MPLQADRYTDGNRHAGAEILARIFAWPISRAMEFTSSRAAACTCSRRRRSAARSHTCPPTISAPSQPRSGGWMVTDVLFRRVSEVCSEVHGAMEALPLPDPEAAVRERIDRIRRLLVASVPVQLLVATRRKLPRPLPSSPQAG
jgi:hypothetical protein